MKRFSILLVSILFLVSTASNAQTEKAPAPKKSVNFGEHGGVLYTSGDRQFEFNQKNMAFLVSMPGTSGETSGFGKATFTITEKGKTSVTVSEVEYKNGFYTAIVKEEYENPQVVFQTTINGKSYSVNMQMPNKN